MSRRVLFHGTLPPELAAIGAEPGIEARAFRADAWSLGDDEVGVLLAGPALAPALAAPEPSGLGEAADRVALVLIADRLEPLHPFWEARPSLSLPEAAPAAHVARAVRCLHRFLEERVRAARDRRALMARSGEIKALVEVGIALSAETDRGRLLETILSRARALTAADAGSLYLVEGEPGGEALRFALAQNDAVRFEFAASLLALDDSSIAAFVARSGETVRLADVRALPADAPYRFDAAFDDRHGYRTRSILAVPMSTPQGRTIGVLQLINRMRRVLPDGVSTAFIRTEVVPFDQTNAEIAQSLAAQAAVAVENRRLTESIRALFEGFVEASVTAIEQRDPATSGHSHRVAGLTCALAEATAREVTGPYGAFRIGAEDLRELRYAAVLHDFGKVGVREDVLVKARKLSPGSFALARARFDQALLSAAAEVWEAAARSGWPETRVAEALEARHRELARAWEVVERANEPTVLPRETASEVEGLRRAAYRDAFGRSVPLLEDAEIACLAIPRGSLTLAEREEIESHVTQTYRFLARIPWTRDLARVPDWAYAHHEKLDGSGYPRRLASEAIPAPVRMLTICDIFDALAARDRPYKQAVPGERALEILGAEASRGAVDGELLRIFTEAKLWQR
jgi:HD-GYP domain-containing protein (c-di-GMP phosphodiesterase class II)